jgi:hypothetical protein
MKHITKMALIVLALAGLAGLAVFGVPAVVKAAEESNTFSYDVACDCRTGATLDGGVRGAPFMIQGKIFPAGTLHSGNATNDPTLPVNGIASIGDWICRGQVQGTYPPAIASAYSSTPFALNTQYFILKDGGALTAEGYDVPTGGFLSVTGGIGRFSGVAGDIQGTIFGTNATGCPNFRAKFRIQPGSERGGSN